MAFFESFLHFGPIFDRVICYVNFGCLVLALQIVKWTIDHIYLSKPDLKICTFPSRNLEVQPKIHSLLNIPPRKVSKV